MLEELQTEIPKAFETEGYTRHRDQVLQQLEEQRLEKLAQIDRHAAESGFKLLKGPGGLTLAPAVGDKLLSDEDPDRLTGPEREKVVRARDRLQHEIEERLRVVRELEKGIRDALRALDTDTAVYATRRARYRDLPAVLEYLSALQTDITAHADEFRKGKEQEAPPALAMMQASDKPLARYQVNVLVNNSGLKGAPVVVETNPTFHNLTGRIEHQATLNRRRHRPYHDQAGCAAPGQWRLSDCPGTRMPDEPFRLGRPQARAQRRRPAHRRTGHAA